MLVNEEQLDHFRNLLIDLEVTHFAVIEANSGQAKIFKVSSIGSSIMGLTQEDGLIFLNENENGVLAKLQQVDNYLQITINPLKKENVYYFNNPENPELIFAQPYDFLVTGNHLIIFLPTESISLDSCTLIKAKFSKVEGEIIETKSLDSTVFESMKKEAHETYHDIRIFDHLFISNLSLVEELLEEMELAEKQKYVNAINNFKSQVDLVIALSDLAFDDEKYQLAFNFLNHVEHTLKSSELTLKKWRLLFRVGDIELLRDEILEFEREAGNSLDDRLMGFLSKAVTFGVLTRESFPAEIISRIEEWLYNRVEICVDPLWLTFESEEVNQFISKEFSDVPRELIINAANYLVSDYYHKFPSDSGAFRAIYNKQNAGARFSYDSPLISLFDSDDIIKSKIEEAAEGNAFQRLLLHIEHTFIRGKKYDGYRGYKNRREFMEKESIEFAESFLKNLNKKD